MLNELTIKQRRLAEFMSELSEKCYAAGWLRNLEYVLWNTLLNGERKLGQDFISKTDIVQLNEFSEDSNCWIYFDDDTEETAIDLFTWKQKFKEVLSQNPDIING